MNRVNIYGFPHKGLKNGLTQLLVSAGKADVTSQSDVIRLKESVRELVMLLNLHQEAEDSVVIPAIKAKAPGSTDHNEFEHQRLHAQVVAIDTMASELEVGDTALGVSRIFDAVGQFLSDYLAHMADEEGEMNAIIWQHFSDQEILEWQGQIMGKLSPEEKMAWFKYIVPALNPMERQIMLGGVKEAVPIEAYRAIIQMLEDHMSDDELQPLVA